MPFLDDIYTHIYYSCLPVHVVAAPQLIIANLCLYLLAELVASHASSYIDYRVVFICVKETFSATRFRKFDAGRNNTNFTRIMFGIKIRGSNGRNVDQRAAFRNNVVTVCRWYRDG